MTQGQGSPSFFQRLALCRLAARSASLRESGDLRGRAWGGLGWAVIRIVGCTRNKDRSRDITAQCSKPKIKRLGRGLSQENGLLPKFKDLSSDLWHPRAKLGTVMDGCNPCTGGVELGRAGQAA